MADRSMNFGKSCFYVLFTLLISLRLGGQTINIQNAICDCANAQKINVQRRTVIVNNGSAPGIGRASEISNQPGAPPVFEREHNSYWYLLEFTFEGEVEFVILPKNPNDDYDFIVYNYTDTSTCAKVRSQSLNPVRSNIARTNLVGSGRTGLSHQAEPDFVGPGPGSPFSASIQVKKGAKFLLVLDDLNSRGQGHSIEFTTVSNYKLSTNIITKPTQQATIVTFINNTGDTVFRSMTNHTGQLDTALWLSDYNLYTVWIESDSCLSEIKAFAPKTIGKNSALQLNDTLYRLTPHQPILLDNVYFKAGSSELDSASFLPLKRVVALMIKYPAMKIQINGHVNGDSVSMAADKKGFQMKLSEDRAAAVKQYLVSSGVDPNNILVKGYGGTRPIIPNARTSEGMRKNMRVEIEVITF